MTFFLSRPRHSRLSLSSLCWTLVSLFCGKWLAMSKKRTSKKQFEIYLSHLRGSDLLRTGKLRPNNDGDDPNKLWSELIKVLNGCGDGPIRTVTEWKKVFTEWKSATRKKARDGKQLNNFENELLMITGQGSVTGLPLKELGGIVGEENPTGEDVTGNDVSYGNTENIILEYIEENPDGDTENVAPPAPTRNAKKRSMRVTYQQYEMYLSYLTSNSGNFIKLCEELNKCRNSPSKSVLNWQQTFRNWTSATKRKARQIYISQHMTGGGLPIPIFLTDLEEALLQILGKLCVIGMAVHELGLSENTHKEDVTCQKPKRRQRPVAHSYKGKVKQLKIIKNGFKAFREADQNISIAIERLENAIKMFEIACIRYTYIKYK